MKRAAELPSGRRGQLLALAMLAIALMLLWLAAGAPLHDWYMQREARLDEQRLLVERMAKLAASLPELSRDIGREAGNRGQAAPQPSDTDALAAADLEQHLVRLATDAGAEIASAETLTAEQAGGLRRIRLRVALTASWPVLLKLLGAIETDPSPLLIDDVELRAETAPDPDQPTMQARFSVIALRSGTTARSAP